MYTHTTHLVSAAQAVTSQRPSRPQPCTRNWLQPRGWKAQPPGCRSAQPLRAPARGEEIYNCIILSFIILSLYYIKFS